MFVLSLKLLFVASYFGTSSSLCTTVYLACTFQDKYFLVCLGRSWATCTDFSNVKVSIGDYNIRWYLTSAGLVAFVISKRKIIWFFFCRGARLTKYVEHCIHLSRNIFSCNTEIYQIIQFLWHCRRWKVLCTHFCSKTSCQRFRKYRRSSPLWPKRMIIRSYRNYLE